MAYEDLDGREWLFADSEKTVFMKRIGEDFIIHYSWTVHRWKKTFSNQKSLLDGFISKESKEVEITGWQLMEWFIGLSVEQTKF